MASQDEVFLAVGPGGIKGFYMLGVLHQLWINGKLDKVGGFSGSSVGAMICLLLNVGYAPVEIIELAADLDIFSDFYQVDIGQKIMDMKRHYGLMSNIAIRQKLEEAVESRLGQNVTLSQLYMMTGKLLYVCTYNVTKDMKVYISHISHPDMLAVDAVLLSINIPLIFYMIQYEDDIYMDGGFVDPLPVAPIDDGHRKVIAIYARTQIGVSFAEPFLPILTSLVHKILMTSIHHHADLIRKIASPQCTFVEIPCQTFNTTGIGLGLDDKVNMVLSGDRMGQEVVIEINTKISDL